MLEYFAPENSLEDKNINIQNTVQVTFNFSLHILLKNNSSKIEKYLESSGLFYLIVYQVNTKFFGFFKAL